MPASEPWIKNTTLNTRGIVLTNWRVYTYGGTTADQPAFLITWNDNGSVDFDDGVNKKKPNKLVKSYTIYDDTTGKTSATVDVYGVQQK